MIPVGYRTRREVAYLAFIPAIKQVAQASEFVLAVCAGSALLAKTCLLDGKKAPLNIRAFDWASTQGENVNWIRKARWTRDEKYYTSGGISAGMDMTLGLLKNVHGIEFARKTAFEIEYNWTEDMEQDNFLNSNI